MQYSNVYKEIYQATNNFWKSHTDNYWFETQILQKFKDSPNPGKELAFLIERTTRRKMQTLFPSIIGQEINLKTKQKTINSIGDFWIQDEKHTEPVNIKFQTTARSVPHMVSMAPLLKAIVGSNIRSYWILSIYIDKDSYDIDVKMFDLLKFLDCCYCDLNFGKIMLKPGSLKDFDQTDFFTQSYVDRQYVIDKLMEINQIAFKKSLESRLKNYKFFQELSKYDSSQVDSNTIQIQSDNLVFTKNQNQNHFFDTKNISKPGAKIQWSQKEINNSLLQYMKNTPNASLSQIRENGPVGLASAINRTGGFNIWREKIISSLEFKQVHNLTSDEEAKKLVKKHTSDKPKRGAKLFWTEEKILSSLSSYIENVKNNPSLQDIRENGPVGLASAIHRGKGINAYKEEAMQTLGSNMIDSIKADVGPDGANLIDSFLNYEAESTKDDNYNKEQKHLWSNKNIENELLKIVEQHGTINTHLIANYKNGLPKAVTHSGGIKHWRNKLGLTNGHDDNNQPATVGRPKNMSKQEVEIKLLKLVEQNVDITFEGLKAAGKDNLLGFIKRNGGIHKWRVELGLEENGPKWNKQKIENYLKKIVEQHDELNLRLVEEANVEGLAYAVRENGGIGFWQKQLLVDKVWNEERIKKELVCFAEKFSDLKRKDFEQNNRMDLYNAMANRGGVNHWKALIKKDSFVLPWGEERIDKELGEFIKQWPDLKRKDFEKQHRMDLYYAMADCGGVNHWKAKFGLKQKVWNNKTIKLELGKFIKQHPNLDKANFEQNNRMDLYNAMANRGGVNHWKAEALKQAPFAFKKNNDMV